MENRNRMILTKSARYTVSPKTSAWTRRKEVEASAVELEKKIVVYVKDGNKQYSIHIQKEGTL